MLIWKITDNPMKLQLIALRSGIYEYLHTQTLSSATIVSHCKCADRQSINIHVKMSKYSSKKNKDVYGMKWKF